MQFCTAGSSGFEMGGKGSGERGVVLPLGDQESAACEIHGAGMSRPEIIYGCRLDHATLSSMAVYTFCGWPLFALVVAGSGMRMACSKFEAAAAAQEVDVDLGSRLSFF